MLCSTLVKWGVIREGEGGQDFLLLRSLPPPFSLLLSLIRLLLQMTLFLFPPSRKFPPLILCSFSLHLSSYLLPHHSLSVRFLSMSPWFPSFYSDSPSHGKSSACSPPLPHPQALPYPSLPFLTPIGTPSGPLSSHLLLCITVQFTPTYFLKDVNYFFEGCKLGFDIFIL